ncbi:hypothetical protein HG530_008920 [Fusarium avenaceum]|nr:hypothetical protein HG530_008920 [Fusarium avenaceum]
MGVGKPRLDAYERILSRLFENLALFHILKRGGDTTTLMALEVKNEGVVFWIAANLTLKDHVLVSLADILEDLGNEPKGTDTARNVLSDTLARKCIGFAAPRLKKEYKCHDPKSSWIKRVEAPVASVVPLPFESEDGWSDDSASLANLNEDDFSDEADSSDESDGGAYL